MPVRDKKQLFVYLLSHVRQGTERANQAYQELSQLAQNPQVKDALEARAFISQRVLEKLDQCFKLINEQPVKLSGRLAALKFAVDATDYTPTKQAVEVYEELAGKVDAQLAQLRRVLDTDLAQLNRQLRDTTLPVIAPQAAG